MVTPTDKRPRWGEDFILEGQEPICPVEGIDRIEEVELCLQAVEEIPEEVDILDPGEWGYYDLEEVEGRGEGEIAPFPWRKYRLILLGLASGVMLSQCLF